MSVGFQRDEEQMKMKMREEGERNGMRETRLSRPSKTPEGIEVKPLQ